MRQTAHGNSPELCRRSSPVLQIMICFPAFILSPFSSIASFQVKSLLTHFASDSAMTIRSSAGRSSHGTPQRSSRVNASSTMMKSNRLTRSLGEHKPSLQALHYTPHQNGHGSWHWYTSPGPSALSLIHTKFPQCPPNDLPGHSVKCLLKVYENHVVSCWQLDKATSQIWFTPPPAPRPPPPPPPPHTHTLAQGEP